MREENTKRAERVAVRERWEAADADSRHLAAADHRAPSSRVALLWMTAFRERNRPPVGWWLVVLFLPRVFLVSFKVQ